MVDNFVFIWTNFYTYSLITAGHVKKLDSLRLVPNLHGVKETLRKSHEHTHLKTDNIIRKFLVPDLTVFEKNAPAQAV